MKNLNYDFIKNLNNRESTIKAEIKKRKILEVQIQKIMKFFETNDELTRSELEKLKLKVSKNNVNINFFIKSLPNNNFFIFYNIFLGKSIIKTNI